MDWIESIASAWKGHRKFAQFLVEKIIPETIVELGVDYGYSTFVFANALKDQKGIIYGIDLFEGDIHAGNRNTHQFVLDKIEKQNLTQIKIIVGDFKEVSLNWNLPINILHIDGLHTYEAVKSDYENWSKFVKEDGIILFHDVTSFKDIAQFFKEVEGNWHKLYFTHSAGLGILTKNIDLKNEILNNFKNVFEHDKNPL